MDGRHGIRRSGCVQRVTHVVAVAPVDSRALRGRLSIVIATAESPAHAPPSHHPHPTSIQHPSGQLTPQFSTQTSGKSTFTVHLPPSRLITCASESRWGRGGMMRSHSASNLNATWNGTAETSPILCPCADNRINRRCLCFGTAMVSFVQDQPRVYGGFEDPSSTAIL